MPPEIQKQMKKVGLKISFMMALMMSFALSLTGNLTAEHPPEMPMIAIIIGFLESFVLSFAVSFGIGLVVPMPKKCGVGTQVPPAAENAQGPYRGIHRIEPDLYTAHDNRHGHVRVFLLDSPWT